MDLFENHIVYIMKAFSNIRDVEYLDGFKRMISGSTNHFLFHFCLPRQTPRLRLGAPWGLQRDETRGHPTGSFLKALECSPDSPDYLDMEALETKKQRSYGLWGRVHFRSTVSAKNEGRGTTKSRKLYLFPSWTERLLEWQQITTSAPGRATMRNGFRSKNRRRLQK